MGNQPGVTPDVGRNYWFNVSPPPPRSSLPSGASQLRIIIFHAGSGRIRSSKSQTIRISIGGHGDRRARQL